VLTTDTCHRSEWGGEIPTHIARDFIYAAVRHPAVAAFVTEYVFDGIRDGEGLCDIAEALRVAIDEILNAAAAEDWEQVGRDLIAWARNFLEPARSDEAAPTGESLWPRLTLPPANVARRRKPPVRVDQEAILAWMRERRPSATPAGDSRALERQCPQCAMQGLTVSSPKASSPSRRASGATGRRCAATASQEHCRSQSRPALRGLELSRESS